MKKLLVLVSAMAFVVFGAGLAFAGEWHTGVNNLCTDCHTMHFSQTHNWDGTTNVPATPAAHGNWLGATGPNQFLLKAPANQLCLSCHDGQTYAPDVLGLNNPNASPTQGRSAGALNELAIGTPYEEWKGHTLDSTNPPPGYNPVVVGLAATLYPSGTSLECTSCHTQHGGAGIYRNLGPRSLGANRPTYVIGTTNSATADVWINIPSPYTVNSGNAATFNPYYDAANVFYNRNDKVVGTTKTSNGLDTMCAACHGNFHGGGGDTTTVGGVVSGTAYEGFLRHPTSQTTIGQLGSGHSTLTRYTQATTKVKTYSNNIDNSNASPGCVTCHKSHGNQNPFGLIFLSRSATNVGEQGGYAAGQVEAANGYQVGYRNLCGQCHSQGNN